MCPPELQGPRPPKMIGTCAACASLFRSLIERASNTRPSHAPDEMRELIQPEIVKRAEGRRWSVLASLIFGSYMPIGADDER